MSSDPAPEFPWSRGAPLIARSAPRASLDVQRQVAANAAISRKAGRHLSGGKAELRAAKIAEKRAARATAGDAAFDARALLTKLRAARAARTLRIETVPLSTSARGVAARLGGALRFTVAELGGGGRAEKRRVVFTLCAADQGGDLAEQDDALAESICLAHEATLSGVAFKGVLLAQREARKVRRERRAAAAGISGARRERPPRSVDDDEGRDSDAGHAGGARETSDRPSLVTPAASAYASRMGINFVSEGSAVGSKGELLHSGSSDSDDDDESDDSEFDEGDSSSVSGDSDDVGSTDCVSVEHQGLGAREATASTPLGASAGGGLSGGAADDIERDAALAEAMRSVSFGVDAAPTASPQWEAHTRAFGSRMLERMGWKGGVLGTGARPSVIDQPALVDREPVRGRKGLGS